MNDDSTARWNIGERMELIEQLGAIKIQLARMEERDIFTANQLQTLTETQHETRKVAFSAKAKIDRLYWMGGALAALIAAKDKIAGLF